VQRLALVALLLAVTAVGAETGRGGGPPAPGFAAVIPKPLAESPERGAFVLRPSAAIVVQGGYADAVRVARLLAATLRPSTGYALPVSRSVRPIRAGSVVLALEPGDRSLGDEGYRLRVTHERITVTARRAAGLFWGTQTLRQLLPAAIEGHAQSGGPWLVPLGTIHDRPRFAWRGLMLDVARHFFGVSEVKRLVDLMALYKLNRLHLHLTDDQGWRIAVRSWPRLTRVGGATAVGGGQGGYYTQRRYREIVAYAQARFVEVVPEIDMPGHVNAALASYGRLACDGRTAAPYTGIDVGFSSLCIRKELTYRFLDDVIGELAALTPGQYLHIGGDEAHSTDPADYRYFVERVQRIVRAHGKRMLGWEEIARARLRRTSVAQHWQNPRLARRAVEQGAKVVMSPATKAYLDMKYTPSFPLGLSWAGTTSVQDAYTWDPATEVDGVTDKDVLGVEAPLWSETISSRADLDRLAFPRLLGIAEIAWSPAAGRSWDEYRTRLGAQGARLDALGVGFHRSGEVRWARGGT
jgi:hexosaminidase